MFFSFSWRMVQRSPSDHPGTEPKIKFYFSVNTKLPSADKFDETEKLMDQRISDIIKDMKLT